MKSINLVIVCLLVVFGACKSKKVPESFKVEAEVYQKNDYCGGAAPTEEMLAEMTKSKLQPNKTLYVYLVDENNNRGEEMVLKSNEKGLLKLTLKKGLYDVFLLSSAERAEILRGMQDEYKPCSKIFYDQPQGRLHVWQKVSQPLELHVKCNPCLPPAP